MRRIPMPITKNEFNKILDEYVSTRDVTIYVVEDHCDWGLEKLSLADFFMYTKDREMEQFPRQYRAFQSETEARAYLTHMEETYHG